MPNTIKKTHEKDRKRRRSEAEREQRRQEELEHGGWFAAMKWRREQNEKAQNGQSEGRCKDGAQAADEHQETAQTVS